MWAGKNLKAQLACLLQMNESSEDSQTFNDDAHASDKRNVTARRRSTKKAPAP